MAHFHIYQLLNMQTALQQEVDNAMKALAQKTEKLDEAFQFFDKAFKGVRNVALTFQQKNHGLLAELLEASSTSI